MSLNEWTLFKSAFKQYCMETPGILTLHDPPFLMHVDLDRFLEVCCTTGRPLSVTQVDVLMALATYVDIVNVDLSVFPPMVLRQMNGLAQRGNPFSDLRIHLRTENQDLAAE